MTDPARASADAVELLDRDLSILAFAERVLDWARRDDVPLIERLRYTAIVSQLLDEFFEIRMAPQLSAFLRQEHKEQVSAASYLAISARARDIVAQQYAIYGGLLELLDRRGVRVVPHGERNARQRRWVRDYFMREVQPLLMPIGLDPAHPFPQVANKALHFIVRLTGKDAFGRHNEVAIVRVPRSLPRYVQIPATRGSKQLQFVSISSVIRSHFAELFPGRQPTDFSQFRLTRHSDLAVDEEDAKNLRSAMRKGLQDRQFGQAVRLEVSAGCTDFLADYLLQHFSLPEQALFRVQGPVNLVRLNQLIAAVDTPALRFPPYQASWPKAMVSGEPIFERLQRGDVLIHQPFERFDAVLQMLREAVDDPDVLAIKQTIYRAGDQSELMQLLIEAARRGKEVMVVVELRARFDEEANIRHTVQLEEAGAQVVYGVVGLKTHAKMMLITRREGAGLRRYAHVGTGNYNPGTARAYTDLSQLSADPELTADVDQIFLHLASLNKLPRLHKALVAPFNLHKSMLDHIDAAAVAARKGTAARVACKMNALTDVPLAQALLRAAQSGVQVDLIVRGACILPVGAPGVQGRIRVRSVVGRFLEHSRVYYSRIGARENLWLSSADFMNRNMVRRVELAWPVTDPGLRERIVDECINLYLLDQADAWELQADGRYRRLLPEAASGRNARRRKAQVAWPSAQGTLMQRYGQHVA